MIELFQEKHQLGGEIWWGNGTVYQETFVLCRGTIKFVL
jgi:hypothetical protein